MSFFEDIEIGAHRALGSHTFTEEEIVAFASRWDPQPFHLDAKAARDSLFGRLCASGWHTACMWMRLNIEDARREIATAKKAGAPMPDIGPSPGIFDLKWSRPVYVGDTVSYSWTAVDKRESASRPDWGIVTYAAEGVNQNGEPVLTFKGRVFVGRRPAHAATG